MVEIKKLSKRKTTKKTADVPSTKTALAKQTSDIEIKIRDQTMDTVPAKPIAKAGKRSPKALAEEKANLAKEERKKATQEAGQEDLKLKAKPAQIKTRTRAERAGKKYRAAAQLIKSDMVYSVDEACDLAVKTSVTKFDSSVELHIRLNVDPRQADQNIRSQLVLPEGTGKKLRVAVIAEAADAALAKTAGADMVGSDEIFGQLDLGKTNFDVLIAPPSMMPKLAKYARILGPKGLMPNPKSGTVATDVAKAVKQAKGGRVEIRVDQGGIVHLSIGRVSFGAERLANNSRAVLEFIKTAKPASIKDTFVKSIFMATSMGPSIKLKPDQS